jgi:hypothetical protein
MHLIAGTQKPDSQSFDQSVKANMPAVLCFPMVNQVSLRKTKRPFPDSSLAARARRALLNEGFPGKPYVA